MVNEMATDLKTKFGDQVDVKYVDVDKEGLGNYPIMDRVLQMGYPYPITLINGEPKFAGGIMIAEVKQSIEELVNIQ
jgi:disulfide oxidoreductase YuzD